MPLVSLPSLPRAVPATGRAALVAVVVGATVLYGLASSFFVVTPSERAGVRVLGTVTTPRPLGPGVHLCWPFVSRIDRVQVSLTNLHIRPFGVNTVDNQRITLDINITYTTPDSAVFHLLYEVGQSGAADIRENIAPVVQDRAARIFSTKNTNSISEAREGIQAEVTAAVARALRDLFRIELASLQIANIGYSDAFVQSNDRAVLAKNEAVTEENKKKVIEYQSQQRVIAAEGRAREQVAQAQGEAEAARLRAEGEAKATITRAGAGREAADLQGRGEAARLNAEIAALGGTGNYLNYLNAQASLRWNGTVPSFQLSPAGTSPASAPFLFQLPAPRGPAQARTGPGE